MWVRIRTKEISGLCEGPLQGCSSVCCCKYSPDQSKVKRRAGKFLKSKCEISFSIRYLIFESYWAGEILKASKVAFKKLENENLLSNFVNKILKAMSFQIFAISERSKFWKQIAGKSL